MSSQRPLRVLLWSAHGSGEQYHGPASFSYRLFQGAEAGRFEVSLVHASDEQADLPLFVEQHKLGRNAARGGLQLWQFLRNGRRWLDENAHRFDVFLGLMGFHASVAAAYHAESLGLPSVIFIANHLIDLGDKPGLRGLIGLPKRRRAMLPRISALVAMSDHIDDELIGYGVPPSQIARIPMGVDTRRFAPTASRKERSDLRRQMGWKDIPTLVFSGVLTERKRPHLLIEAVGRALAAGHECQLLLAGPDHQQEYARQMRESVERNGIGPYVHFLGMVAKIEDVYRGGDLYALVSRQEGMPAALVEALACGLPSIGTAISGISDLIIEGVTGRIVAPNVDEVTAALLGYLQNPQTLVDQGIAARETVLARFSDKVVLDAYEELFRRLMRART